MSLTLLEPARHELEVKRSRFIALAERCADEQSARRFLASVADPSATHNCWAWKSGQSYRFDDDGEPGGTAGRPILAAIENQGYDQVAVVVIRYYGGIKLGTGGLARAYGGSAAECLRTARSEPLIPTVRKRIQLPFEAVSLAHQLLDRHAAVKCGERYTSQGLELEIECPRSSLAALERDLRDASSGNVQIRSA
ncbi:IMPACT family protein [Wenzhouxiangella marina]|uniref:Uncharacterized protein n=1 Tax=Wenzhouxiangella marina TaxID=1579979 RepID=A0A0K0XWQ1_9GAMM|nr:YigZ family protein [Wenzhouxiangella marina]AKS42108.1 hypothetical protein WM2015_1740 [Wenzhouxiangella marina]MBB6086121.1 putative YigZ family protein [Wenzhouxiangella marina]